MARRPERPIGGQHHLAPRQGRPVGRRGEGAEADLPLPGRAGDQKRRLQRGGGQRQFRPGVELAQAADQRAAVAHGAVADAAERAVQQRLRGPQAAMIERRLLPHERARPQPPVQQLDPRQAVDAVEIHDGLRRLRPRRQRRQQRLAAGQRPRVAGGEQGDRLRDAAGRVVAEGSGGHPPASAMRAARRLSATTTAIASPA